MSTSSKVVPYKKGEKVGRYEIMEKKKEGSFCYVYKALDTTLSTEDKLHIVALRQPMDTENNYLMRRDIDALKKIRDNKHIVPILDYSWDDTNSLWTVTKYFEYSAEIDDPSRKDKTKKIVVNDLEEYINETEKPFEPKDAIRMTLDILDGLIFAHDNEVGHRDLKPNNLLTENDEEGGLSLLITDFNTSGWKSDAKTSGYTKSTHTPSLRNVNNPYTKGDDPIDEKTDIKATAYILCKMMAGTEWNPPDSLKGFRAVARPPKNLFELIQKATAERDERIKIKDFRDDLAKIYEAILFNPARAREKEIHDLDEYKKLSALCAKGDDILDNGDVDDLYDLKARVYLAAKEIGNDLPIEEIENMIKQKYREQRKGIYNLFDYVKNKDKAKTIPSKSTRKTIIEKVKRYERARLKWNELVG